jgi:glucosamine--fructose-6-phosphate aminotransferase (isomerizing)
MENGHYTRQEILSQPEVWSAALTFLDQYHDAILDLQPARHYDQILFTGCGSTYYLSQAAASQTQELTGLPARAFPASELWLSPRSCYVKGNTLLVAISRSGETTETLNACKAFLGDKRGDLLTFSCYGDMPLAKMGILNIVLSSGQERSVAQTRAFTTLYLGTLAAAILWAGRTDLFDSLSRLPEAGMRLLNNYKSMAADLGRDDSIDRFYMLGSGPRNALASELSLKMKEMSLSHSEPFHFMEFRHGPKSMITPSSLVIGLRSTGNAKQEASVLDDIKTLGGRVLDISEINSDVQFESNLDEVVRNVLYLPVGQMIAFERALSKGLDPDHPTNLDTVVKLS